MVVLIYGMVVFHSSSQSWVAHPAPSPTPHPSLSNEPCAPLGKLYAPPLAYLTDRIEQFTLSLLPIIIRK